MFNTDATRPRYNETIGTDINGNPITPNDVLNKYFDDIALCTIGEPWRYFGEDKGFDFEGTYDNYNPVTRKLSIRRVANRVELRGLVYAPSMSSGDTICYLPENYRPSVFENWQGRTNHVSGGGLGINVSSNGQLRFFGTNVTTYVGVNGYFFID